MSQAPTRHSRRLNGEAPSPVRPLPQRSRTPHYRRRSDELNSVPQVEDEVDNNMEVVVEHSEAGDSVPELDFDNWPEDAMGEDLTVTLNPELTVLPHWRQFQPILLRQKPMISTTSFIVHLLFTLHVRVIQALGSPNALDFESTHDESASDSNLDHLFPPVNQNPFSPAVACPRAGNEVSLICVSANVSAALCSTCCSSTVSRPPSAIPAEVAVYLGLPSENPAQCGFLELVCVASLAPSLRDLILALCGRQWHSSRDVEKDLSAAGSIPLLVCFKTPTPKRGLCAPTLDSSMTVIAPRAAHTPTSHEIFRIRGIAEATFFFVLYVFPRYLTAPTVPPSSSLRYSSTIREQSPSESLNVENTDAATAADCPALLSQSCLAYQLSILLEDDGSLPKFGTAYTQIRQILIVEDVIARARGAGIPTSDEYKIADAVPLWAALKLSTLRKQQNVHPGCPRYANVFTGSTELQHWSCILCRTAKRECAAAILGGVLCPCPGHLAYRTISEPGRWLRDCDYDQGKGQGGERQANPI
ncbi:hypothetical protein R3P38DRAFT_3293637 [Favolaschia claudopus]|uniref:Uncharacterized protein n=1 Tax=Favolaschia claudopus TaxID=2862362 RepID=A0AAV9ZI00_9AGAR